MMKAREIHALGDDELRTKLAEAYQELMQLRFQRETHQITNFARPSLVRRDIARMKSILRERELSAYDLASSG